MSAQAVIDPVEQTLRLGERVWRFDWDPSAATVAIELGGRTYELNGITWRQKRNLARALARVAMPPDRALLRACLRERATLPSEPAERDALMALSEWLSASQSSLPWHPATLAQATLEICRAGALTPLDLDDLPAGEVEELWQAIGAQGPRRESVPGGAESAPASRSAGDFKRIVVMPDPMWLPASPLDVARGALSGVERADGRSLSAGGSASTGPSADIAVAAATREFDVPSPDRVESAEHRATDDSTPPATSRTDDVAALEEPNRLLPSSPAAPAPVPSRRFRVRATGVPAPTGRRPIKEPDGEAPPSAEMASTSRVDAEDIGTAGAEPPALRFDAPKQVRVARGLQPPRSELAPRLRDSHTTASPTSAIRPLASHGSEIAPPPRTARRRTGQEPPIAFLDDHEPSALIPGGVDADRRGFEDELTRAAVEAGIDLEP